MFDAGVDVVGGDRRGGCPGGFRRGNREKQIRLVLGWQRLRRGPRGGCRLRGPSCRNRLVYEVVTAAIQGEVAFGRGRILSVREGYVKFITDDPHYQNALPAELRKKQQDMIELPHGGNPGPGGSRTLMGRKPIKLSKNKETCHENGSFGGCRKNSH